jgi:DNA-directed RNA polymerase specialized sigma subunit
MLNDKKQSNDLLHVMTQEEVAAKLGITRSLAGAIERTALKKIKEKLERRRIKKEDIF